MDIINWILRQDMQTLLETSEYRQNIDAWKWKLVQHFKMKFVLVFALATLAALFAFPWTRFVYLGDARCQEVAVTKKATEPVLQILERSLLPGFCSASFIP